MSISLRLDVEFFILHCEISLIFGSFTYKDVSKLLLIAYTDLTQNEFELKSVRHLSLALVTDFTIEKLTLNSNFLYENCIKY